MTWKKRIILTVALAGLAAGLVGCHRPPRDNAKSAQDVKALLTERPKAFTNSIDMKMVLIPAGEFLMGSKLSPKECVTLYGDREEFWAKAIACEKPVHIVGVGEPFYMGVTEVTQAQWKAVMGTNPSIHQGDDRPVEMVSWHEATEFCKKLSAKEKGTYRLPTEAEWEYACRAGTTTRYCYGDDERRLGRCAWYGGSIGPMRVFGITMVRAYYGIHPVAGKKPNVWGLYDMHGNALEWCQDVWHWDYSGTPTDGSAWLEGGEQKLRVLRGGAFDYPHWYVRCAFRAGQSAKDQVEGAGFRVVASPPILGYEQARE